MDVTLEQRHNPENGGNESKNAFFSCTQGSFKPSKEKYSSKFRFRWYNCGIGGHE